MMMMMMTMIIIIIIDADDDEEEGEDNWVRKTHLVNDVVLLKCSIIKM
jgi:hypothetical protein